MFGTCDGRFHNHIHQAEQPASYGFVIFEIDDTGMDCTVSNYTNNIERLLDALWD